MALATSAKATLLVADDDEALQSLLKRMASKWGLEVTQAFDGESALRLAQDRPDCILLDILMPRLDGRDVLMKLKADPATKSIPVIIFSARGDQSDRLVGLELGADDYIEKPFNLEMLVRKIDYLIWKRHGEPGLAG